MSALLSPPCPGDVIYVNRDPDNRVLVLAAEKTNPTDLDEDLRDKPYYGVTITPVRVRPEDAHVIQHGDMWLLGADEFTIVWRNVHGDQFSVDWYREAQP